METIFVMNMREVDLNPLVLFDTMYSTGNISRGSGQLTKSFFTQ